MGLAAFLNGARFHDFEDERREKTNGDETEWSNCTAEEAFR